MTIAAAHWIDSMFGSSTGHSGISALLVVFTFVGGAIVLLMSVTGVLAALHARSRSQLADRLVPVKKGVPDEAVADGFVPDKKVVPDESVQEIRQRNKTNPINNLTTGDLVINRRLADLAERAFRGDGLSDTTARGSR